MSSVMPSAYGWRRVDLPAGLLLDQRQAVGPVAVHLVGGAVDERRVDAVLADVLQHVEGAAGVDVEVGERVAHRPVVRRLGGGVDDHGDVAAVLLEDLRAARPGRGCRRRGGCTPSPRSLVSRSTFQAVDASAPKNSCRMSLSMPTTSRPSPAKCRTASEPIRPADPVTSATAHDDTPDLRAGIRRDHRSQPGRQTDQEHNRGPPGDPCAADGTARARCRTVQRPHDRGPSGPGTAAVAPERGDRSWPTSGPRCPRTGALSRWWGRGELNPHALSGTRT